MHHLYTDGVKFGVNKSKIGEVNCLTPNFTIKIAPPPD